MDSEGDDYELSGSDQEYTGEERQILEDLRKQRKKRDEDQDPRQEVLAFSDDDDDEDEDDAALMRDSDIEGADEKDDDDLPDTMAWGSKRSTYYNTDFVDQDYSSYNAQEEDLARAEEDEAKKIQLRLVKRLSEADFKLDDVQEVAESDDEEQAKPGAGIKITSDLTGLSARELRQLLQKDSPEFIGLAKDFKDHLQELRTLIAPVLNYVRGHQVPMVPALQFASVYSTILSTHCSNVAFYLLLKARRSSIKFHPVVKRLVQLKHLRDQLRPRYEQYIRPQLEALHERIVDGDVFTVLDQKQRKAKLQILDKYNADQSDDDSKDSDDEALKEQAQEDDKEEEEEEEELEEDPESARRGITYQMAKNKGLTPHRKKELRNPRVKHRGKYRKALVRRKGAVRTVRKETKRYGGELSGIKASVTKSVKFRT
ncbi:hypothetical protein KR018_004160 [Drosophila ironensis]|nr:hypothetical protein KR018_004160 [Drosophila ironensis]